MGAVPSVPRDRSRKLQVIGAGYGRTGTTAISLAIEKLYEGPVMHGGTQMIGREDGECSDIDTCPRCTNAVAHTLNTIQHT